MSKKQELEIGQVWSDSDKETARILYFCSSDIYDRLIKCEINSSGSIYRTSYDESLFRDIYPILMK